MPEHTVGHRTKEALQALETYSDNQANEGAAVTFSRLAESLFTQSFFGGGAMNKLSGDVLESQGCEGWMLDPGGGQPSKFPIALSLDLHTGRLTGHWTLPDGTVQAPSFQIRLQETGHGGQFLVFNSEETADGATYGVCFAML